jgi:hypothetical protein
MLKKLMEEECPIYKMHGVICASKRMKRLWLKLIEFIKKTLKNSF